MVKVTEIGVTRRHLSPNGSAFSTSEAHPGTARNSTALGFLASPKLGAIARRRRNALEKLNGFGRQRLEVVTHCAACSLVASQGRSVSASHGDWIPNPPPFSLVAAGFAALVGATPPCFAPDSRPGAIFGDWHGAFLDSLHCRGAA
jgi:hypothetical protein